MASETIADIVREMRGIKDFHGNDVPVFTDWADRIESAAKRTCEYATNGECSAYNSQIDKLSRETARLRAALKPVLECDFDHGNIDGETLFAQIRECQNICNESNNGESHN